MFATPFELVLQIDTSRECSEPECSEPECPEPECSEPECSEPEYSEPGYSKPMCSEPHRPFQRYPKSWGWTFRTSITNSPSPYLPNPVFRRFPLQNSLLQCAWGDPFKSQRLLRADFLKIAFIKGNALCRNRVLGDSFKNCYPQHTQNFYPEP